MISLNFSVPASAGEGVRAQFFAREAGARLPSLPERGRLLASLDEVFFNELVLPCREYCVRQEKWVGNVRCALSRGRE